jgi:hypothetical protein
MTAVFSPSTLSFRRAAARAGAVVLAMAGLAVGVGVGNAVAASTHTDKERTEDVTRHKAMAAAHEAMANCLASGKDENLCLGELQVACKGLGIGKYCGMKHVH